MEKRRNRNIKKKVFLSEEKKHKMLEKMKKDGFLNFSGFARKQLLNPDFETCLVSFPEYQLLTDRLISVGRAINSIDKSATQFGKISQNDLMELGPVMEELGELVKKQVKGEKQRIAKKGKTSKKCDRIVVKKTTKTRGGVRGELCEAGKKLERTMGGTRKR
ncbi:hypothetical protein, partial [Streptococcus pluranimalium]